MKDVFFASDSYVLTGPSIVNKYYRKLLEGKYDFSKNYRSSVSRVADGIFKVLTHKAIIFSGASKADYLFIRLAGLFNKKVIYIMHGCVSEEDRINMVHDAGAIKLENFYLKRADLILAVSKNFSQWLKKRYPEYGEKIGVLTNGVDWHLLARDSGAKEIQRDKVSIVGGGVPRKNVLSVCKAIEIINGEGGRQYKLIVFGRDDLDSEAIKKFPFVEFNGKIPREDMLEIIAGTPLFIQNSRFDSFALAPIEALMVGCSILCSEKIGALSIIGEYLDCDVIKDCEDENEIASKIKYLLDHPNHDRIIEQIDKENTSFEKRAEELENYVLRLLEKT